MLAQFKKFNRILRILGPGVITGAADDDPSGIATYSQTGAQFAYGQLWTVLFMLPFMTAVQEACARIGAVTGHGLAAIIKKNYSKKIVYFVITLILVANTINIGADIGAMAAAANLVIPVSIPLMTIVFTVIILALEIFTSYKVYAKILKWFVLSIITYPITVFIVRLPWTEVIRATFIPHIEFNFNFLFIITGVFGTTISPYMFFWEASEEVEEEKERHLTRGENKPEISRDFIRLMQIDNLLGMVVSQIATWCIIVVAASVLYTHGVRTIETAADAARALEPLVTSFPDSGFLAKLLFAVGIIGLGLLAVPVLSGSASYAVSEAFSWREGLNLKFKRAHGFYGVITIATLLGLLINFSGISPIKALIFTSVFNGVVSVPLIFLIARIAPDEKIMGEYKSGKLSRVLVWATFIIMAFSVGAMFLTLGK